MNKNKKRYNSTLYTCILRSKPKKPQQIHAIMSNTEKLYVSRVEARPNSKSVLRVVVTLLQLKYKKVR